MGWIQARQLVLVVVLCLLAPLLLLLVLPRRAAPPEPQPAAARRVEPARAHRQATVSHEAWKLEGALQALERQPDNPYLQYVVLMLARPDRVAEVTARVPRLNPQRRVHPETDRFSLWSSREASAEVIQQALLHAEPTSAPTPARPTGAALGSLPLSPALPFPASVNWATLARWLPQPGDQGVSVPLAHLRGP